jgi:hypothetical protein
MNEDKINPQNLLGEPQIHTEDKIQNNNIPVDIKKPTPTEEHPLNILHAQIEKPKPVNVPTQETPLQSQVDNLIRTQILHKQEIPPTKIDNPIPQTVNQAPQTPTIPRQEENITKTEQSQNQFVNQTRPESLGKGTVFAQRPLRTYESDVAEALSQQKATVSTIAIAESERKESNNEPYPKSSNISRKIFFVLLSIIFIVTGLGGGYYLYLKSPLAPQDIKKIQTKIPSIVIPDIQKILSIDGISDNQLAEKVINQIESETGNTNSIHEFILTQTGVSSTTVRVGSIDFLQRIAIGMSDSLLRSLKNQWMLGLYNNEGKRTPFIILSVDFFQNAYAGMLKYEAKMPDKLSLLLGYAEKIYSQNSNSTSTNSIKSYYNIQGKFEDRVIQNRDVREFITNKGDLLVLYSFVDEATLIITTDEPTLRAIIERIEKQTYIR